MTKISSGGTRFNKVFFPILWFGFLAVFVGIGALSGAILDDILFLVVPLGMAVFGYFIMKHLVWDLADEVYDGGEFLLVRKAGEEERILLSNIINVNTSTHMNPPRVTLRMAGPSRFGQEVAFIPARPFSLNPFAKIQAIEDLIRRVDQARSRRAV